MSKSTPNYFHCVQDTRFRDNVYEPEADSFLFLDALDQERHGQLASLVEAHRSRPSSSPLRVLEIGPGSGIVITHLAMIMQSMGLVALDAHAVDINPVALEATELTWLRSGFSSSSSPRQPQDDASVALGDVVVKEETARVVAAASPPPSSSSTSTTDATFRLHLHCGNLFSPFQESRKFNEKHSIVVEQAVAEVEAKLQPFDIVLFNPPYVPTSEAELNDALSGNDRITLAWCGGPKGRVVVNRFLEQLPSFLHTEHGLCYLVAIKENDVEDLMQFAEQSFRSSGEKHPEVDVSQILQRYTGEHLCVVRIHKRSAP